MHVPTHSKYLLNCVVPTTKILGYMNFGKIKQRLCFRSNLLASISRAAGSGMWGRGGTQDVERGKTTEQHPRGKLESCSGNCGVCVGLLAIETKEVFCCFFFTSPPLSPPALSSYLPPNPLRWDTALNFLWEWPLHAGRWRLSASEKSLALESESVIYNMPTEILTPF